MNSVESLISELNFGPMVACRIRKAYPSGTYDPYSVLRGWHPTHSFGKSSVNQDLISVARFIKLFGRDAYRNIPSSAFAKNGKRKAVSRQYVVSAGLK